MKKTLFLAAAGLLGLCFQAQALTAEKLYETESVTVDTRGSHTGTLIKYENGLFTSLVEGVEIYGLITFDYAYANVTTAEGLIYMGNNVEGEPVFGLYTTENGGVTGAWKSDQANATLGAWTNDGTVAGTVFSGKDTNNDGSITLTLGLHPTKGTVFSANGSVTYSNQESEDIAASNTTAQTEGDLYRSFTLKSDKADTDKLTVNTNYVTSVTVDVRKDTGKTIVSNSSGTWSKTFDSSTVAVLSGTGKHEIKTGNANLGKGSIVVSGTSQMFLQTWKNGGDLTVADDIYIGSTSIQEGGYNGVAIRFGNDGNKANNNNPETQPAEDRYKTTLTGTLYVVENAHIKSGSSNAVIISGNVTDIVDKVDTGSTLTVSGAGISFTGKVDLKGIVINNGATFGNTVTVENMTAGGNIGVGDKITATNLTLNANATLTFSGGTLDVVNSITLSTVTLSDYSKYFDADNLTQTLVTSGGISGWNGAIEGTYTANDVTYNTVIDQQGNNIVLTYIEQKDSITTSVSTEAGWFALSEDGMTLTLTVTDSLAGLTADGSVMVNLLTEDMKIAITKDANYQYGSMMLKLTDGTNTITADTIDRVVFVKGTTGLNYWGEMVDFGGEVGTKLAYNVERIPEPTTTTLSLLALAGLAARRRRQK